MDWNGVYRIRVFGEPVETPRPRHRIVGKGENQFVQTYVPSKADAWKRTVRYHALPWIEGKDQITGPIRVDIEFIMPRPAGHFGTGRNAGTIKPSAPHLHAVTPDKDNLEKTILDALSPTPTVVRKKLPPKHRDDPVYDFPGLWRNDSQVCCGFVEKRYHRAMEQPGAMILVSKRTSELVDVSGRSL